jgi:hypothetical protein
VPTPAPQAAIFVFERKPMEQPEEGKAQFGSTSSTLGAMRPAIFDYSR